MVIPLDVPAWEEARVLVERLGDDADFFKVGLELYTREGPRVVRELKERGKRVFLDLKLHDIPATVSGAAEAAASHQVDLLTVHTTGGRAMMEAAAEGARRGMSGDAPRTRLLGVTLLTSLSGSDVESIWGRSILSVRDEVIRLAGLAREAGLDGVVSSPLEARPIRRSLGEDALVVTPGIRLAGGEQHDQVRVATPAQAVEAGADHLVVGRAITAARDPKEALARVRGEIAGAEPGGGR